MTIELDPKRSAVLVMDAQTDILTRYGAAAAPVLERTGALVAAARAAGAKVIYVVVGFRAGHPEIDRKNALYALVANTSRFLGAPGADIAAEVRPHDGDAIVVKHRVSAFHATDLDMLLRAQGIDTLVLTGFATSGVVLSTVRAGADADYRLVVAADCCGDVDPEVHRVLTDKVFVRQATVATGAEVAAALTHG